MTGSTYSYGIHRIHRSEFPLARQACSTCRLASLCLPLMLCPEDVAALERIVQWRRPLGKGAVLYRAGDRFSALYAVRSGSLKSTLLSEYGQEQVSDFLLPGELVGLDAIAFGYHPTTATALETTSVCEIPFMRLEALSATIPGMQHRLLKLMSRVIVSAEEMMRTLVRGSGEQRLAVLLLDLSERFARRGLSPSCFRLPMLRHEIGNYLGLTPETTSRLFKRFEKRGWIVVTGAELDLLDLAALHESVHMESDERSSPKSSRI